MKIQTTRTTLALILVVWANALQNIVAANAPDLPAQNAGVFHQTNSAPIPLDQIGAVAGKQYSGDGLCVLATNGGALLRCVFQRMEGEVARDGLWLKSTVPDQTNDRFRVKAVAVGNQSLPDQGDGSVEDGIVRFSRPGLVEEYSVSMDGVRQDFLVLEKPAGEQELRVQLEVKGAKVEQTATGARLVLKNSRRRVAYNRLRVTDAKGRELPVRMEVRHPETQNPKSEMVLVVVVDVSGAAYPIRIDPTFSDANWVSMGGTPGANGSISAMVVDSSGNLYIGGQFTLVGDTLANGVAKWNGSSWAALGLGLNGVDALAVSGSNVYAGGTFTTAGGIAANHIAKWDGSSWSSLGSGMNGIVFALEVSGNNVYAGGQFTTAGGSSASHVAKWDGSDWSALSSGLNGVVHALAMSGGGPIVLPNGMGVRGALWVMVYLAL